MKSKCPILILEIYFHAKFNYNPYQTHLNKLIKIFRKHVIVTKQIYWSTEGRAPETGFGTPDIKV